MSLAEKALLAICYTLAAFGIGFACGAWVSSGVAEKAQQAAMQSAASEIAKIKLQSTVVNQKVIEHIKTEKVYADCAHSPDAYKALLESYK